VYLALLKDLHKYICTAPHRTVLICYFCCQLYAILMGSSTSTKTGISTFLGCTTLLAPSSSTTEGMNQT